ncbi:MAG: altronate dehydratase family protein [Desulfuromonadales bacterium]|nr:altronate dehydratase family protein [Desulfuromonadales bacterium]
MSIPRIIRLHADDNVVVAADTLAAGTLVKAEGVTTSEQIPAGHKLATRVITAGAPIYKYSQIIGFATVEIPPGSHVHTHNCGVHDFQRDYAVGAGCRHMEILPQEERAVFQGIVRADGRVATRNYIGVMSTVNCSATVCRQIAAQFVGPALSAFPNVDSVVPLVHNTGCAMASSGEGYDTLMRTLRGYLKHPNFAGILLVGLGCEVFQTSDILGSDGPSGDPLIQHLNIQSQGGTRKAVTAGVERIHGMLQLANDISRQPVSASHLKVALQCGGSDAYSGITANPALGAAADLVIRHGGTAILAETSEIYGAEHLLTRRASREQVAAKLIELIHWWEDYTRRNGGEMNNNPSPGNKAGGLTTILEKSLGAVSKGGTSDLVEVYRYAEPITASGLVFMDSPGYDPCSITGEVASGANIVCFTTGAGSAYGCKPSPSIKLASNSRTFTLMEDDMDINCGIMLDSGVSLADMGEQIFRHILEVASGQRTKSEMLGIGDSEFIPWNIGAVM